MLRPILSTLVVPNCLINPRQQSDGRVRQRVADGLRLRLLNRPVGAAGAVDLERAFEAGAFVGTDGKGSDLGVEEIGAGGW